MPRDVDTKHNVAELKKNLIRFIGSFGGDLSVMNQFMNDVIKIHITYQENCLNVISTIST